VCFLEQYLVAFKAMFCCFSYVTRHLFDNVDRSLVTVYHVLVAWVEGRAIFSPLVCDGITSSEVSEINIAFTRTYGHMRFDLHGPDIVMRNELVIDDPK